MDVLDGRPARLHLLVEIISSSTSARAPGLAFYG
jgi:hypothetical protein